MSSQIAMPVAGGFEDSELTVPYERLQSGGHNVVLIGTHPGEELRGKRGQATVRVELVARDLEPDSFEALVIPGGYFPDGLRLDENIVEFVRRFGATGKTIAAICHGPLLLIEAGLVKGRTMTSWPSLQDDLENAGATWVDREVVEDGNFVTSRKPDDLDAFCDAILRRRSIRRKSSPEAA
jgi:protease I